MKKFITFLAFLLIFSMPLCAKVTTTQKTDGYADYVYVAGSKDNYPVEYYDDDSHSFCGIIPDFLGKIQKSQGLILFI